MSVIYVIYLLYFVVCLLLMFRPKTIDCMLNGRVFFIFYMKNLNYKEHKVYLTLTIHQSIRWYEGKLEDYDTNQQKHK
jgi:hypothetical protein